MAMLATDNAVFAIPSASGTKVGAEKLIPGYISPVAPTVREPLLEVEECYVDLMMAVPSQILPPPTSYQIPFQEVSVYTRSLSNGENYTENFTSIPSSVGMVVLGLRNSAHTVGNNRELYSLGKRIRTATFSLGNLHVQGPVDVRRPDHEQFEQGVQPPPVGQRPDRRRAYPRRRR